MVPKPLSNSKATSFYAILKFLVWNKKLKILRFLKKSCACERLSSSFHGRIFINFYFICISAIMEINTCSWGPLFTYSIGPLDSSNSTSVMVNEFFVTSSVFGVGRLPWKGGGTNDKKITLKNHSSQSYCTLWWQIVIIHRASTQTIRNHNENPRSTIKFKVHIVISVVENTENINKAFRKSMKRVSDRESWQRSFY